MSPAARSTRLTTETKSLILFTLIACAGVAGVIAAFYLLPDPPADLGPLLLYLLVKGGVYVAATVAVFLGPVVQLRRIAATARANRKTGDRG